MCFLALLTFKQSMLKHDCLQVVKNQLVIKIKLKHLYLAITNTIDYLYDIFNNQLNITTMKHSFLFIIVCTLCLSAFSQMRAPVEKSIAMKGRYGYLPTSSVRVDINSNNTLRTTFYQELENVTVTVMKVDGEIISTQTMNVKEYETFYIKIDNYTTGSYIIEIEATEGAIEGSF